jgi:hypothetical protein
MSISVWIGAVIVAFGAVASFAIPRRRRQTADELEPSLEPAA